MTAMAEPLHIANQDLFVPHRLVQVGVAGESNAPVRADTVRDPVGLRAIDKLREDVRDLPKRERIIKVGLAGEKNRSLSQDNNKVTNLVPNAIGDVYPGEHRHIYELEPGDRILNIGAAVAEIGRWVKVEQVQIIELDGVQVSAEVHGISEAGYQLILGIDSPNAQVRLVTDKENPYG
jgi:hypothetical protein